MYAPYASSLYVLDGVVMMSDRIVIPAALRRTIVSILHAAHQSIDRMKARASDSVFWPGLIADITKIRLECSECNKIAKSNPQTPPYPPTEPEFPFQQLAADYFQMGGINYVVVVDRYSHWPMVFRAEHGAIGLIKSLREVFTTFGVAEELASDGAKEFTADITLKFLSDWGVRHRLSSVAYPHSNCRAELGVKQVKRILAGNLNASGSLDVDSFQRAMLSYRNTKDPVTKFSPALAVFGRQVRDGLPILKGKYNPHETWKELLDHREKAMAKRHVAMHEAWNEHTKKLLPLKMGDRVFVQNQTGNHPRRWERTGIIVEVKDFDQYSVRIDGTGRHTLRNRKFLRLFKAINRDNTTHQHTDVQTTDCVPAQSPIPPEPSDTPVVNNEQSQPHVDAPNSSTHVPDHDQEGNIMETPDDPGACVSPPKKVNPSPPPPTVHTPEDETHPNQTLPPTTGQPSQRPQRIKKPNPKYSSEEYDLSCIITTTPLQFMSVTKVSV